MEQEELTLLREFARTNSEEAFTALVSRHVNLVYSVALREARDAHLAEEVTQAVFILLARKAPSLNPKIILAGWLCRTARYVSGNLLAAERRRQNREQEAYMQSLLNEPNPDDWSQIAPLLEKAMRQLAAKDHDAVVLRFYQKMSFAQVGTALGATEPAAKMRVSRALEKLRAIFAKQGVVSTTTAIAVMISANGVHAAPPALANIIAVGAVAHAAAAHGSNLTIIKGALKVMAWTKAKMAMIAGVVLVLAGGSTTAVMVKQHSYRASFQKETRARQAQSMQLVLASFKFAAAHSDQLPDNLDDLAPDPAATNLEIVSSGKLANVHDYSKTVLLREKEPRQFSRGTFVKVYAFVDGRSETLTSPDKDFSAKEKVLGLLVQTKSN